MVRERLPFKESTARRFMIISGDERLRNAAHARHLPSSWMALYELTKLKDDEFDQLVEEGVIHSEMQRGDIKKHEKQTLVCISSVLSDTVIQSLLIGTGSL